ncbi:MAG: ribonuclease III domain-containing protein, partial [Chloroflexota bacterium]
MAGQRSMDDERPELNTVQERLGLAMNDAALLLVALTHSSYVHESAVVGVRDNQRLEFLGDAVVDTVVAEWLFRRYPAMDEGELTLLRARLVRTNGLARLARERGVGEVLRLGRGEAASGGHHRAA